MTALISGLINVDKKDYRLKSLRVIKVCLVSDCSELLKWIFMSHTTQTSPGRLVR